MKAHSAAAQPGTAGFRAHAPRLVRDLPRVRATVLTASPPATASPASYPSSRSSEHVWVDRVAAKQRRQKHKLSRLLNKLQYQLSDLDGCNASDDELLSLEQERLSSGSQASVSGFSNARASVPVAASPEVLITLARRAQEQSSLLQTLDVSNPKSVASRLLLLSQQLSLPPDQLLRMARMCGSLMLQRTSELAAAMDALTDSIAGIMASTSKPAAAAAAAPPAGRARNPTGQRGGWAADSAMAGAVDRSGGSAATSAGAGGEGVAPTAEVREAAAAMARSMVAEAPRLLLVAPERLRRSGMELGAVCKARGIKLIPMLQQRPDLLLQSASSLAAKVDVLPAALGLPPKRVREVLQACPDLLRRSPHELTRRYRLLQELFGVPPAFLAELVSQEPRVLSFGAATLRAKFESLASRYGRFQDDVADMILVDPSVLINAEVPLPGSAAPAVGVRPSRSSAAGKAAAAAGVLAATPSAAPRGFPLAAAAAAAQQHKQKTQKATVLDRLAALSASCGVPVGGLLQLVVKDPRVGAYSQEQVRQRLAALAEALQLPAAPPVPLAAVPLAASAPSGRGAAPTPAPLGSPEVRRVVGAHPGLLALAPEEVQRRVEAVAGCLRELQVQAARADARSSQAAGGAGAAAVDVMGMLRARPDVLLQPAEDLPVRLASLRALLGGPALSPSRLLALVAAQPSLLLPPARPVALSSSEELDEAAEGLLAVAANGGGSGAAVVELEVADRLVVMQSLFEIPRALVVELVIKEPALLGVSVDELERKFRALAGSFGAFSNDAINVVLADPSLILRADSEVGAVTELGRAMEAGDKGGSSQVRGAGRVAGVEKEEEGSGRAGGRQRRTGRKEAGGAEAQAADVAADRAAQQGGARQKAQGEAREGGAAAQQGRQQRQGGGAQAEERGGAAAARGQEAARPSGAPGDGRQVGAAGQREEGPAGNLGALGTMSAADFDKLGQEGLPPPPPPRRRRR